MNTAYMWGLKLAEEDPTAAELPGTAPNPPGFFSTVGKPLLGAAAAATLLYGGYKAHQLSPQFREELRYQRRTWPSAARWDLHDLRHEAQSLGFDPIKRSWRVNQVDSRTGKLVDNPHADRIRQLVLEEIPAMKAKVRGLQAEVFPRVVKQHAHHVFRQSSPVITDAALLGGAYGLGKYMARPEGEEAPVKEAMALPLRLGAMGAVAGAGIQGGRAAWNGQSGGDIARAAGKGALVGGALGLGAGAVHGMGHEAGLAAGAEKGMNDLNALRQEHAGRMERVYGAHREELNDFREERQALLNQIRRMQKGASAWDTVKQFAKGHTATNSPLAAGAHAALAKGTMFGGLTAGYTALKGRQEGEGWGDLAQRSAISGVKGSIGGAISTGLGAGAMQHFVNKAHAPGAAATGWMAQARHLHPQAASGPQTFAHMQQAASPKEYMQRMVDVSKGNYPGGASKESPYAFPMT